MRTRAFLLIFAGLVFILTCSAGVIFLQMQVMKDVRPEKLEDKPLEVAIVPPPQLPPTLPPQLQPPPPPPAEQKPPSPPPQRACRPPGARS